jgi:hypothetical protein
MRMATGFYSSMQNNAAFLKGYIEGRNTIAAVVTIVVICWGDEIWCWLWGCDELDCHAVIDLSPLFSDCNNAEIKVFGGGDDIVSYMWLNTNSTPGITVTSLPLLALARTDPTLPVVSSVTTVCSDGTILEPYSETITFPDPTNSTTPQISIMEAPPTAPVNTPFTVYSSHASYGLYELTWSTSAGGTIVSTGFGSVTVKFAFSGTKTVTATYTNLCSGTFTTATATIFVI